jgi:carnitine 3-dehydrogenase
MSDLIPISRAAAIGGGVIGGGWVARLLLAGVDVTVYDPAPDAERLVLAVLANAERAYAKLTAVPLPKRGRLTFAGSIEAAVEGADFIQESVPERLDLKRSVLARIDTNAAPDALIGSSTSGLLPSDLQADLTHPERLIVAHPYNPVYLLPLVEVVAGRQTSPETVERARKLYAALGMKAVVIAREIEAFVGDRLLEALWREALWLIKDDICDVETLDDVIRYSFGLRWAQMGLFQTYRIAGGEAGMRHFLAQFGPCLQWPWTKLTDVPDLDDALVDKIAAQSDAQANGLGIRELERIRDDNLVAILHGLKGAENGAGWGAGAALKQFEDRLWLLAKASGRAEPEHDLTRPLVLHEATVSPAWLDYNGHMTEFRYLQVLGDASDAVLRWIGIDAETAAGGSSYFTAETHIRHLSETKLGARLHVETQVLAGAGKRLHLFHRLIGTETGRCHATGEHILIHVSGGKPSDPPDHVARRVAELAAAHGGLARPDGAGRYVGQPR